ncbi:MAG: hypothetical protein KF812_11970 [Fimbriimonadaceae bacterium]|nr:hypothetical protein [Fimbriimonadaceae bacterium]
MIAPTDLLIPFVASLVAAPITLRALRTMKSRQTISAYVQEHAHKQGTPTMGGIIVLIGFLVAAVTIVPLPDRYAVIALALGFGFIGFVDDYVMPKAVKGSRGLEWKEKLILQVMFAAGAAFLSGAHTPLAIGLGIFAVLFMSNAYNFADGMDGLAGGLGVVIAGTLALMGFLLNLSGVTAAMAALAVCFIPFLVVNWPPARVFMGDVGALPFGALMGWAMARMVFLETGAINTQVFWPLLILSLVMLIELVPVPLQIASVKLRKGKRMFPFKTPVHHAFQSAGWPENRVVALFYLVQILAAAGALLLFPGGGSQAPWIAIAGILFLLMLIGRKREESHPAPDVQSEKVADA